MPNHSTTYKQESRHGLRDVGTPANLPQESEKANAFSKPACSQSQRALKASALAWTRPNRDLFPRPNNLPSAPSAAVYSFREQLQKHCRPAAITNVDHNRAACFRTTA
jgi:hypothetical protein